MLRRQRRQYVRNAHTSTRIRSRARHNRRRGVAFQGERVASFSEKWPCVYDCHATRCSDMKKEIIRLHFPRCLLVVKRHHLPRERQLLSSAFSRKKSLHDATSRLHARQWQETGGINSCTFLLRSMGKINHAFTMNIFLFDVSFLSLLPPYFHFEFFNTISSGMNRVRRISIFLFLFMWFLIIFLFLDSLSVRLCERDVGSIRLLVCNLWI